VNLSWYIIRGSGIAAYALLSASVIWGLLISTKVFGRAIKAKGLQWIHESIALSAVIVTVVHLVALSMDEYIGFSWLDILVPGVNTWEPIPVALGITAFWTMVVVTFSFYVKKWISQGTWRSIHYLSFGTFLAALGHGVFAGTDTGNPWVAGMYVGTLVVAVLLTALRIILGRDTTPTERTAGRSAGGVTRGSSRPASSRIPAELSTRSPTAPSSRVPASSAGTLEPPPSVGDDD
jgi:predicted ferric reductase